MLSSVKTNERFQSITCELPRSSFSFISLILIYTHYIHPYLGKCKPLLWQNTLKWHERFSPLQIPQLTRVDVKLNDFNIFVVFPYASFCRYKRLLSNSVSRSPLSLMIQGVFTAFLTTLFWNGHVASFGATSKMNTIRRLQV